MRAPIETARDETKLISSKNEFLPHASPWRPSLPRAMVRCGPGQLLRQI
jgi:hypothetical protein